MPRIHIDENGNVAAGPSLPLPLVLDGVFQTSSRSSYLNDNGNESGIPPPPSGRGVVNDFSRRYPGGLHNAYSHKEPVDNGLHHGHVMNDANGLLDESELSGITQFPARAMVSLAYAPHIGEGTLFTTQSAPPPGTSGAGAGYGGGLPRAPGGGVAPRQPPYGTPLGPGDLRLKNRLSVYDAARVDKSEDKLAAEMSVDPRQFGSIERRMKTAQKLAGTGDYNPLETINAQGAAILQKERSLSKKIGKHSKKSRIPKNYASGRGPSDTRHKRSKVAHQTTTYKKIHQGGSHHHRKHACCKSCSKGRGTCDRKRRYGRHSTHHYERQYHKHVGGGGGGLGHKRHQLVSGYGHGHGQTHQAGREL